MEIFCCFCYWPHIKQLWNVNLGDNVDNFRNCHNRRIHNLFQNQEKEMNKYLRKFLKTLFVMILVFIPLIIAKEIFDFELKWWQFLIYFLIAFEIWDFIFDVIKEFTNGDFSK